jgi:DHA2 family multidrug resistance protein
MGFWGLGIVVAPIFGPVLGGWLTDNYSWRWVFYINIPVGITSFIMTRLFIFDPAYIRQQARRIDYWGIGMLAVGIGALQYVLDKGQEDDWFSSRSITVLAIVSAVTLTWLVIHELRTDDPVVDLRVFKERSYAVGVFLMTVMGFVLYGSLVLLPIMLQTLLGYPPMLAGIAWRAARVIHHDAAHRPLTGASLIHASPVDRRGRRVTRCSGCEAQPRPATGTSSGRNFCRAPASHRCSSRDRVDVVDPRERMGNPTSLFNLMRNIGGSISIAVTGTMLVRAAGGHGSGSHVTA